MKTSAIGLIVVACVCCVIGSCIVWLPRDVDHRLPFDSAAWKRDNAAAFRGATYDEIYLATRDSMVEDLLKQHQFVGMQKNEVTALLGEPDYSRSGIFRDWDLIYWLGPDHRGALGHLDSKWLVFRCDDDGRITQCQATVD